MAVGCRQLPPCLWLGWAGGHLVPPSARPGLDPGSCPCTPNWQVPAATEDGESWGVTQVTSLTLAPLRIIVLFSFLWSVKKSFAPPWPGKGREGFALGRIVLSSLPLSSLPATSSFKSTGLFQGLGKTAKKSSGTPSVRATFPPFHVVKKPL